MNWPTPKPETLTISSYPPRACGIATYSQDLLNALRNRYGHAHRFTVCALEDGETQHTYDSDIVKYTLDTTYPAAYTHLAETINARKQIKAILLQHEFGLFGGMYGEYLIGLLKSLEKPVITTFHSVLPNPDEARKNLVEEIGRQSEALIVMTNQSAEILKNQYEIASDKIFVIPHGTHVPLANNLNEIKVKYDLDSRPILSTFGLLSPNKSIETALEALPEIKSKFPDVLYLVLGKTHPGIVKTDGENYREFLEAKVKALGIEHNVRFVNRYLDLNELLQYLSATGIYLFTSKDPHQAVSGTFAYAMSSGCPIISTAIPHARELVDADTGLLIDFERPDQLAKAALKLLGNKPLRKSMGHEALHRMQPTHWANVAVKTGKLLEKYISKKHKTTPDYPDISLAHLDRLTTSTGIIQFSKLNIPDPNSGYTLDDNARALLAVLRYYELFGSRQVLDYLDAYLQFIEKCQRQDGSFLNYVDEAGAFQIKNQYVNLEDSNGRAIWALGQLMASQALLPPDVIERSNRVIQKYLPHVPDVKSPRAMAFIIKGLYHYNQQQQSHAIIHLIDQLAERLVEQYHEISNDNWKWFEKYLTYGNSTLPEATLYAYLATKKGMYQIIAKTTFDFLLSHLFEKGQIKVISNNGWFHYNETPNEFGEQPIDVAYTIEALDLFYNVFKENRYRSKMDTAFSWFLGNNHLEQYIYNATTGGCYDGLEEFHVNLNQGAESTVCYLIARLTMEKYLRKERPSKKVVKQKKSRKKSKSSQIAASNRKTMDLHPALRVKTTLFQPRLVNP